MYIPIKLTLLGNTYRIPSIMKVETNIIESITARKNCDASDNACRYLQN